MRIALIDPFYDVSHRVWAQGLQKNSGHKIDIYAGSPYNWKWKMTGGTISITREVNLSKVVYDHFLVTDMVNLPLFKSLLKENLQNVPCSIYFHENQITYPWSPTDTDVEKKRDHHYGFINYSSALVAKKVFFNSLYHSRSFLNALPKFLQMFPEQPFQKDIDHIISKSLVLPIGLDLPQYYESASEEAVFLWNHRWEYDKNPSLFFEHLFRLKAKGYTFKVIVLGKSYKKAPSIFEKARAVLKEEIIHFGYVQSSQEYKNFLEKANIMFVTSNQDFFGISIVEAISAGCYPFLPNRLSYLEHVPSEDVGKYIYAENECLEKLEMILQGKLFLKNKAASSFVQKYNWENLIDNYDTALSL